MSLRHTARVSAMLLSTRAFLGGWALAGDPTSQVFTMRPGTDPYLLYERVRSRGRLHQSKLGMRATASYQVTDSVLRDQRFGVAARVEQIQLDRVLRLAMGEHPVHPIDDSFLSLDPPKHTRLRRTVAPWFTPRALRDRAEPTERLVEKFLDELSGREHWDLIGDFAVRVPIKVICDLFDIPSIDYERFSRWGAVLGSALDGVRTIAELKRLRATLVEMEAFFDELIERRRREPGDDIVSAVVHANPDDLPIAREDVIATCQLLLVAGFETTVNLIGNASMALMANPEARRVFIQRPELAPNLIEEVLRYDPPVQFTVRMANEPITLEGVDLPRNAVVALMLAGANRDPDVFPEPHRLDLFRDNSKEHLSFSAGIHYCLGAGLAKIEGVAAVRALFTKYPDLGLAGPVVRRTSRNIRGALHLPVRATVSRRVISV